MTVHDFRSTPDHITFTRYKDDQHLILQVTARGGVEPGDTMIWATPKGEAEGTIIQRHLQVQHRPHTYATTVKVTDRRPHTPQ